MMEVCQQVTAPADGDDPPAPSAARAGRPGIGIATAHGSRGPALAGIFLVMLAIGYVAMRARTFIDAATVTSAKELLFGLMAGDLSHLNMAGVAAVAVVISFILIKPLLVIGCLLAIELWVGPAERSRKNYLLGWVVRTVLLVSAALVQQVSDKIGLGPSEPLLGAGAGHVPIVAALWTLSLYLVALLVADFIFYWFHRANHRFALLWRFHAIHHSARDLDVLHNITHPVEYAANFLIIVIPASYLIPAGAGDFFLFAAFLTVQTHLIHMNVPIHFGVFGKIFGDNRFHFIHHSIHAGDRNANFANMFPVFDMMFGTYRRPAPGPLPETGIDDQEPPATLRGYLLPRSSGTDSFRADSLRS